MTDWDVKDPSHRTILKASREWGVSPSVFMGREPKVFYAMTENGDYSSEPEASWTDEDRQAALDLLIYESNACPGCGDQLTETTDPVHQFNWVTDDPTRCHKCTAISSKSLAVTKDAKEHDHVSALFITAHLKEEGETADVRSSDQTGPE